MGEEDANESCGEDIKPVCKESTVPTEYIGEFLFIFNHILLIYHQLINISADGWQVPMHVVPVC